MELSIMAGYKVELKGTDELVSALMSNKKMTQVREVVKGSTINIARQSQQLVPVGWGKRYPANTKAPKGYRGGTLKRSMTQTISNGGLEGKVMYDTAYAAYQEYGTRKLPARHYIKKPFESEKEVFISKMKGLVK